MAGGRTASACFCACKGHMSATIEKTRLWNTGFTCMFVSRFFASCSFMMFTTTLAPFAMDVLGVDAGSAGAAISIFTIGILVARLFAGGYVDVIGRKRMTVFGGILCLIATAAYLLPFGFPGLIGARLAHGIAYGIFTNTTMVIAASFIPQARLGEGLGILSLTATLAIAVGPLAGTLAIGFGGYNALFFTGLAFAVVSLVFSAVPAVEELPENERTTLDDAPLIDRFISREAVPVSLLICLCSICIACPNTFVNAFCTQAGYAEASSLYFIVYSVVMCITRPIMGRLVDSKGDNLVVYPSLVLFTAAFVMLGLDLGVAGILLAAVLMGLGYGGLFPSCQFIVTRRASNATLGVVTSTFFILSDVGLSLGPVFGGIVVANLGYVGMFSTCVPVALFMSFLYVVVHGRLPEAKRRERDERHE